MSFPSKQLDQFVVRLPDGMRDRIRKAAEANNRSMNAEIVATLEEKYPPPPPPGLTDVLLLSELLGVDPSEFTEAEIKGMKEALFDAIRGRKRP